MLNPKLPGGIKSRDKKELIDWIVRTGKYYTSALLPNDIERGEIGECFDTCALRVAHHVFVKGKAKYRYVEGVAMCFAGTDRLDKLKGIWVLHAWLTDGVHAFDTTWLTLNPQGKEVAMPAIYVGFEMKIKQVVDFMAKTKYQGILANGWRAPELAEKSFL